MASFAFDDHTWYEIQSLSKSNQSLSADSIVIKGTNDTTISLAASNSTDTSSQFQFYPASSSSNSTWLIRTNHLGSNFYLAAKSNDSSSSSYSTSSDSQSTIPIMRSIVASPHDTSMLWNVTAWADGTSYFLTNAANGTQQHLALDDSGTLYMSSDLTDTPAHKFTFNKLNTSISNPSYSSAIVPSALPSPNALASSSSSSSPATSSTHTLSTPTIAALSITLGLLVSLLILLLAFFLQRRSRRAHANSLPDRSSKDVSIERKRLSAGSDMSELSPSAWGFKRKPSAAREAQRRAMEHEIEFACGGYEKQEVVGVGREASGEFAGVVVAKEVVGETRGWEGRGMRSLDGGRREGAGSLDGGRRSESVGRGLSGISLDEGRRQGRTLGSGRGLRESRGVSENRFSREQRFSRENLGVNLNVGERSSRAQSVGPRRLV